MKPGEGDQAYLWDMLQACREILEFAAEADLDDFIADRKLSLAVERALEIVGEAAGRVSGDYQDAHPDIPWRKMKGMRNILAHEYGEIDYQIIYRTVREQIPGLKVSLERLLPAD